MPAFFIANIVVFCYTDCVMEKRIHLFVSRKNVLTWLMALCMVSSAVARIAFSGLKGSGDSLYVWSQIVLPVAASLLICAIVLINGDEMFFKTAIPVWMFSGYWGFYLSGLFESNVIDTLFWIALIFFAVIYAEVSCGKQRHPIVLFLLWLAAGIAGVYFHKEGILGVDIGTYQQLLPDALMILGMLFVTAAVRVHPIGEYHPTWGDRPDGRRVRTLPPMSQVSPYIMVTRNTSTNFFEDAFEISHVDRYIRQKRREGLTNFGITHVLLACYVRTLCKYPGLNRFLAGQKVYSRGDDIQYCMVIKKEMTTNSPDTAIKVHLSFRDTADDVYNKLQAAVEKQKNTSALDSNFDATAAALNLIPGLVLKFTVWLLTVLDYFGLLPKFLLEVSPFHGSLFFTSMGSLGIPPIYHHLYDFGNLPVFGSFGMKRRAYEVQEDGSVVQRKYVDVKFTTDERIVDGFYYAAFFKHYKRLLQHPEVLDNPPDEIVPDID